jgi:hypothetical protein
MTAAELQAAAARLYVDEAFREWFMLAPARATARYELTAAERDLLTSLDRDKLAWHCDRLRDRQCRLVKSAYPLTARVLDDEVARYSGRFYDLGTLAPGKSERDYVILFGQFLHDSLGASPSVVPYDADLCRYELLINELTTYQWTKLRRCDESHGTLSDDAYPALLSHVRLGHFEFDIPAIVDALQTNRAAKSCYPKPTSIVFRAKPESTFPELLRISGPLARVLDRCTGDHTIGGLRDALGDAAVPRTIEKLVDMRIVGLV